MFDICCELKRVDKDNTFKTTSICIINLFYVYSYMHAIMIEEMGEIPCIVHRESMIDNRVRGIAEWSANNNSPKRKVSAVISGNRISWF